ncbi:hypothetical protein AHAS_Ahas03G0267800 [Arachis hypogaea]
MNKIMSFNNILRTTPLSLSSSNTKPIISHLLHSPPTSLFRLLPSKTVTPAVSFHQQQRRRLRGGVVAMASHAPGSVQKSEEEWRAILSPEQFRILRQKGTEYPGTGEYDKFFGEGVYNCAGCGTPLYKSTTKFNSGCGWPAFFEGLPGAINRTTDNGVVTCVSHAVMVLDSCIAIM